MIVDFGYYSRDLQRVEHLCADIVSFSQDTADFEGWAPEVELVFTSAEGRRDFIEAIEAGERDHSLDIYGRIGLEDTSEDLSVRIIYDSERVRFIIH